MLCPCLIHFWFQDYVLPSIQTQAVKHPSLVSYLPGKMSFESSSTLETQPDIIEIRRVQTFALIVINLCSFSRLKGHYILTFVILLLAYTLVFYCVICKHTFEFTVLTSLTQPVYSSKFSCNIILPHTLLFVLSTVCTCLGFTECDSG